VLSKRICKKCINHYPSRTGRPIWDKYDDEYWEGKHSLALSHKIVACPQVLPITRSWWVSVDSIPDWCPFALEHLMETQNVEQASL